MRPFSLGRLPELVRAPFTKKEENGALHQRDAMWKVLEQVGFSGSSTSRQDGYLQEAINRYEYNGGVCLELPSEFAGKWIRMDAGLIVDVTKTSITCAGQVNFDHSNQTSGDVVTLKGTSSDINAAPFQTVGRGIRHIIWHGPGTSAVGGICPEGSSAPATHKYLYTIEDGALVNFKPYSYRNNRDTYGVCFKTFGFRPTLDCFAVCWYPNERPDGQLMTNAGERMTFLNCTGLNGGTFFVIGHGNTDVHFLGGSIDQFLCVLDQTAGQAVLQSVHIENKKDGKNWFRVAGPNAAFHLDGGVVYLPEGSAWNDYDIFHCDDVVRYGGIHVRGTHFSVVGSYNRPFLCGGGGRNSCEGSTLLDSSPRIPWSRRQSVLQDSSSSDSTAPWAMQLAGASQRTALDTIQIGMAGARGKGAKLRVKSLGGATATARGGNTGNGVMSAVAVGSGAKAGTYKLTIIEPVSNGGAFTVEDPEGIPLPSGSVGAPYAVSWLGFTLADGSVDFVSGDQFDIVVAQGAAGLTAGDLGATYRANSTGTQGEIRLTAIDGPNEARGDILQPFSLSTEVASYHCFSASQANVPILTSGWRQPFVGGATATATVNGGSLSTVTMVTKAGGYGTTPPVVTVTGGGGTGAVLTPVLVNGVVDSLTIENPGVGFTSAPTISIAPSPLVTGSGARLPSPGDTMAGAGGASRKLVRVDKTSGAWNGAMTGYLYFLGSTAVGYAAGEVAKVGAGSAVIVAPGGSAWTNAVVTFPGADTAAQRAEAIFAWRPGQLFTMCFTYSRVKGGAGNGKGLSVTVAYLDANYVPIADPRTGTATQSGLAIAAGADVDTAQARVNVTPPPAGTCFVRVRIETTVATQTGDVIHVVDIAVVPQ